MVFNEPVETSPRGVEGLVLTEWKVADDEKAAVEKLREARVRADLYREGALAGVELRGYRYLIIVSQKRLFLPKDVVLEHAAHQYPDPTGGPIKSCTQDRSDIETQRVSVVAR